MRATAPKLTQSRIENLVLDHLDSHEYGIVESLLVLSPQLHENLFEDRDRASFLLLFVLCPALNT